MKKLISLALCLAVLFSLVSCSTANNNASENDEITVIAETDSANVTEETECQHVFKETVYKEPGYGYNGANCPGTG